MKLSFDGIRKNLADAFNDLADTELTDEQLEPMRFLRQIVGCCCGLRSTWGKRLSGELTENTWWK